MAKDKFNIDSGMNEGLECFFCVRQHAIQTYARGCYMCVCVCVCVLCVCFVCVLCVCTLCVCVLGGVL